jgi:hypothetical protein
MALQRAQEFAGLDDVHIGLPGSGVSGDSGLRYAVRVSESGVRQ